MAGNGHILSVICPSTSSGFRICTFWGDVCGRTSELVTTLRWVQTALICREDTEPGWKNHLSDVGRLSSKKFPDRRNPFPIFRPTPHFLPKGRAPGKSPRLSKHFCLPQTALAHPDLAFGFRGAGKQSRFHKIQETQA